MSQEWLQRPSRTSLHGDLRPHSTPTELECLALESRISHFNVSQISRRWLHRNIWEAVTWAPNKEVMEGWKECTRNLGTILTSKSWPFEGKGQGKEAKGNFYTLDGVWASVFHRNSISRLHAAVSSQMSWVLFFSNWGWIIYNSIVLKPK